MALRWTIRIQAWHAELRDRLFDQHGATAVEYALMLALIFVAVASAVAFLGKGTNASFNSVKFAP